jgi:uncharacterized protein YdeI (YjbR/CyaY-like superfamily)
MTERDTNPEVDSFFLNLKSWREELILLRSIVLNFDIDENLKWRQPCYSWNDNNIMVISGFKNHCLINFFRGALINDKYKFLTLPGENTQSSRQMRFTSVAEITEKEEVIKSYIREAIEIEKAGLKVNFKKTEDFSIPEEFQTKLNELPTLKKAFEGLTHGRQRAYLLYFSAPKQSQTRNSRIEKYIPHILESKGLYD